MLRSGQDPLHYVPGLRNPKSATLIEISRREHNHIPVFWNPIADTVLHLVV